MKFTYTEDSTGIGVVTGFGVDPQEHESGGYFDGPMPNGFDVGFYQVVNGHLEPLASDAVEAVKRGRIIEAQFLDLVDEAQQTLDLAIEILQLHEARKEHHLKHLSFDDAGALEQFAVNVEKHIDKLHDGQDSDLPDWPFPTDDMRALWQHGA